MGKIVNSLKTTKSIVIKYLEAEKRYRDNDEVLVSRFWADEMLLKHKKDILTITAYEFLTYHSKGKITSADVITRARRKAQEENRNLRGASWNGRKEEEEEVRIAIANKEI